MTLPEKEIPPSTRHDSAPLPAGTRCPRRPTGNSCLHAARSRAHAVAHRPGKRTRSLILDRAHLGRRAASALARSVTSGAGPLRRGGAVRLGDGPRGRHASALPRVVSAQSVTYAACATFRSGRQTWSSRRGSWSGVTAALDERDANLPDRDHVGREQSNTSAGVDLAGRCPMVLTRSALRRTALPRRSRCAGVQAQPAL